ncbi:MAG: RusA family crossover junction endodeoxyribonuclease [Ruminococcus sp.]|nr:RusA family crossover junction endodeoxyribonuclease [Ruminococcus sp.]
MIYRDYVRFSVLGQPIGKGRPKFTSYGKYPRAYTPEKTASFENLVKMEYRRQCKDKRFADDAMIGIVIYAYYAIPKSASKKKKEAMLRRLIRPTVKPDYDNIAKIVSDALNGIAYADDKNIVDSAVHKFYSYTPGIFVELYNAKGIAMNLSFTSTEAAMTESLLNLKYPHEDRFFGI